MKTSEKYQRWIDARKNFKLSHKHIQMARELGMTQKNLANLIIINKGHGKHH